MTASAHQRFGSGAGAGAGAPWSGERSVDVAPVALGATDGRGSPPGRFLLMEITHVSCRSAVGTVGRGRSRWWRRAGAHSTGTRQGGGAAGTADSTRGLPHQPCVVHAGALDGREAGNAGSRDQQEKGPPSGTRPRGRRGDEPRGPGRLVTRRLRKTPRTGNGRGEELPRAAEEGGHTAGDNYGRNAVGTVHVSRLLPGRARGACRRRARRAGRQPTCRAESRTAYPTGRTARPDFPTGPGTPRARGKPQGPGCGKPYESDGYPHTGTEQGLLA